MPELEKRVAQADSLSGQTRLITAALPYINNVPHLGHIVGSHLPADIFARYCRSKGCDTLFIGGTDEHGAASEIAAAQIGVDLKTFSDRLHLAHKEIYDWFGISYDIFSRTSRPIHYGTTQEIFRKLIDKNAISPGKISVFYSPEDGRFLPDRYVEGTCPKCNYEDANADQCERCTTLLDATQLINPRSAISKGALEIREANHLFLRLDEFSDRLEDWLHEKIDWRNQVTHLALGWIKEGLKPRCITRDLKNGVQVPLEGYEGKVFYVWFDAPIGYISATKEAAPERWEEFWKDPNSRIYNFLGKDNIPFHTIFWPAMLMACGDLNLPFFVEGMQYLTYEGQKFSKSKRIGVFCEKLPETKIDPDIMRAYLTLVIPESGDSEFKWSEFQGRVNSELIGNFGNFINRTLTFIYKNLGNSVARPVDSELKTQDINLLVVTREKVRTIEDLIENVQIKSAFQEILSLSREGNRYLSETRPWSVAKDDVTRARHILYLCANLCKTLSIVAAPYVPGAAQRIWEQLNLPGRADMPGNWDAAAALTLPDRHPIKEPRILFEKITPEFLELLKSKVTEPTDIKRLFENG